MKVGMRPETTTGVKFRLSLIQGIIHLIFGDVVLLLYDNMLFIFCTATCLQFFSGEAERVEMVIDDVVIEVSKHRGIGRMYLTNFR